MLPNKSQAREWALKFLYQCEIEKLFFFSDSKLQEFVKLQNVPREIAEHSAALVKGVFDQLPTLDEEIGKTSSNWSFERISIVDRTILRLALFELLFTDTPPKVILNEAIELAKTFGSDQSSKFVNGILDTLARKSGKI